MNKYNIEFIENEAFEKKVNIRLCNELINFIALTSDKDSKGILNKLEKKCIWFEKNGVVEIHEICQFEYLGELLERYEEKIGNNIDNIRAIALAIGYSTELITSNMIIGNQLINFVNKINVMAKNDIYLKGALYLYDNKKYVEYKKELLNKEYDNTEDIIFVFSIFDDIEKTFDILNKQIISLIGINKTIRAINNVKLYAWLIKTLYDVVRKDRRKEMLLLKKIISIPTKQIKNDDDIYNILIVAGYSKEEIYYLNYMLLLYNDIPNKVRLGNSITEERIAINFCRVILNSSETQKESIYILIKDMINLYNRFDIKCAGNDNLKDAILEKLSINNPITFFKFYEIFKKNIFEFDILDEKWDILSKEMNKQDYRELFDKYIEQSETNKETLEKAIEKYVKNAKEQYLPTFFIYEYYRQDTFDKLVDKEIILLNKFFEDYEKYKETQYMEIRHLNEYVKRIKSKNAFIFMEYILEKRKYNIEDIEFLGFDLKELFRNRRYSYCREKNIDINKPFLTTSEKQKLFFWLENYMFKVHPNEYIDFIITILEDDKMQNIISNEDLRYIYLILSKVDLSVEKDNTLRKRYLTELELLNIEKKEQEAEERERQLRLKAIQETMQNKFDNIYKDSFKVIYDFCYTYRWHKEEWKICEKIVKPYIDEHIEKFKIDKEEIINFMELFELFLEEETISVEQFKKYIFRYLKEGLYDKIVERAC